MARELSIEIRTETTQAEAGLARVEKGLQGVEGAAAKTDQATDKVTKSTSKLSVELGSLVGLLVRLGGPAMLLGMAKQTAAWADNIDDLSQKTDISRRSLQQWEQIGKGAGVTMDAIARAAQRLGADLVQGDKSVVRGIKELGFNIEELLALSPEDRFKEVARAIAGIEDPAKRAALAEDILKRSGIELLGIMEKLGNSDEHASAMADGWIEAGALMQDMFDATLAKAKQFASYFLLAFPKSMLDGVEAWKTLLQGLGIMGGPNAPGLPGNPLKIPGAAGFDPLGGNTMGFIEQTLTKDVQEKIRETERAQRDLERTQRDLDRQTLKNVESYKKLSAEMRKFGQTSTSVADAIENGWLGPLQTELEDTISLFSRTLAEGGALQRQLEQWARQNGAIYPTSPGEDRPNLTEPERMATDWGRVYDSVLNVVGAFQQMAYQLQQVQTYGQAAMASLSGFDTGLGLGRSLGMTGGSAAGLGILGGVWSLAVGINNARQQRALYRDSLQRARGDLGRMFFEEFNSGIQGAFPGLSQEFLNLQNSSATEASLERMADIIGELRTKVIDTNVSFGSLAQRMQRAGMEVPQHLRDAVQTLRNMGILTKENTALLDGLMDRKVDAQLIAQTADRFGVDKDSLGGTFQTARFQDRAKELIDAWNLMTNGGREGQGGVLSGMKDELQAFLNDALKKGFLIPENFRPLFQNLFDTGQLLDPFTGEPIQGMHEIRFGEAIETEMDKLTNELQTLLGTLNIDVTGAIGQSASDIVGAIERLGGQLGEFRIHSMPVPNPSGDGPVPISRGGIIQGRGKVLYFNRGGFVPMGTDSVPAMLTPGEAVLSREAVKKLIDLELPRADEAYPNPRMPRIIDGQLPWAPMPPEWQKPAPIIVLPVVSDNEAEIVEAVSREVPGWVTLNKHGLRETITDIFKNGRYRTRRTA